MGQKGCMCGLGNHFSARRKNFRLLIEKKREPFLVLSHNTSGVIRMVGMKEYLEVERK
jgi:hypothetical protein